MLYSLLVPAITHLIHISDCQLSKNIVISLFNQIFCTFCQITFHNFDMISGR